VVSEILSSLLETQIETLDISDNYIKEHSIEKLGLLMRSKQLKTLKISDCNIEPEITESF
jgi:Ran GTPase-activating protein (RanGAP) involved in mRNA processing and transport